MYSWIHLAKFSFSEIVLFFQDPACCKENEHFPPKPRCLRRNNSVLSVKVQVINTLICCFAFCLFLHFSSQFLCLKKALTFESSLTFFFFFPRSIISTEFVFKINFFILFFPWSQDFICFLDLCPHFYLTTC